MSTPASRARTLVAVGAVAVIAALALQQAATGHGYRAGALVAVGLGAAIAAVLVGRPSVRYLAPAATPALVAAAFGVLGRDHAAVLAAGAALLVAGLIAAGVDVAAGIGRGVAVAARLLTAAAGGLAWMVLVLPAWAWTSLRRRPALTAGGGWQPHHDAAPAALGGGAPAEGGRRRLTGRIAWGVGCVVLVLAADYGVGWAWDRAVGDEAPVPVASVDDDGRTIRRDPRNDLPAMADAPWRERYFADLQRTTGSYWPYTEYRPDPFTSPYINLEGWERTTYRAPGEGERPTLWMFGGSTTWGEGQRDGHTIPSEVARLAEAAGTPLDVRNFGQRGWTHFQEMVLFEQLLASEDAPTFASFYDGANEITAQSLLTEAVPSHTLVAAYARLLTGTTVATEFLQTTDRTTTWAELVDAYREHSAVAKVVDLLRGDPAGAQAAGDDTGATTSGAEPPGIQPGAADPGTGLATNYRTTAQDGIDAGKVYERTKPFTLLLSERHGVEPFLFWQPVRGRFVPEERAREQLTAPTIDLSEILDDHRDVFIDGGHTNEEGARLVAQELWDRIEPSVQAWYRGR